MLSVVTDYIKANWKHFQNPDKFLFIKEIEERLEVSLGLNDDFLINFLQWMKEQEVKK